MIDHTRTACEAAGYKVRHSRSQDAEWLSSGYFWTHIKNDTLTAAGPFKTEGRAYTHCYQHNGLSRVQ